MITFKSRDNRLIVGVGLELDLFGRPDVCDIEMGDGRAMAMSCCRLSVGDE